MGNGVPDYVIERRIRFARKKGELSLKEIRRSELQKRCRLSSPYFHFMSKDKQKKVRSEAMSFDLRRWF